MERHRSGDFRNISKALNIPWSTVKTIIKNWKVCGTTKTLPRSGRPSKLDDQAMRRLIREATKRPMATLKEQQAFMAKTGHCVHMIIFQALHKSSLQSRLGQVWEHAQEQRVAAAIFQESVGWIQCDYRLQYVL